jgi:hypothetical protein
MQRYFNAVIIALGLIIASAVVGEFFFPDSHLAKTSGFLAFGALCVLVRAVPPKFLVPKSKKL